MATSDDSLARSQSAMPESVDADYDAIHATIVETERGRWFLDEYARRHRGADTDLVLAAIGEVEQAIRSSNSAEPAEAVRDELAAIVETIRQAREEVIGRHGDPAASGEAAIADFHNAAEQVQELVLAHDTGSDLTAQLSFQINRLVGAGDRLERSVAALRVLLGLLDDLDLRLRGLTDAQEPVPEAAPEPVPPATVPQSLASPMAWSVPAAASVAEPPARPEPLSQPDDMLVSTGLDGPPSKPDTPHTGALWDLTVAPIDPAPVEAATGADPALETSLADWAFVPADREPEPAPAAGQPLPPVDLSSPPADLPISALERLEAREYGRRLVATAVAPPPDTDGAHAPLAEPDAGMLPGAAGLDDLIVGTAPVEPDPLRAASVEPAPEASTAVESLFDTDLFDTDDEGETPAASGPEAPTLEDIDSLAEDDGPSIPDHAPELARAEPSAFLREMTEGAPPEQPLAIAAESEPAHDGLLEPQEAPLPAMPALPDPEPEMPADEPPPAADPGAEMPSVRQRLEDMRTAIASLMDEVSEKRAGRRTPPQS